MPKPILLLLFLPYLPTNPRVADLDREPYSYEIKDERLKAVLEQLVPL